MASRQKKNCSTASVIGETHIRIKMQGVCHGAVGNGTAGYVQWAMEQWVIQNGSCIVNHVQCAMVQWVVAQWVMCSGSWYTVCHCTVGYAQCNGTVSHSVVWHGIVSHVQYAMTQCVMCSVPWCNGLCTMSHAQWVTHSWPCAVAWYLRDSPPQVEWLESCVYLWTLTLGGRASEWAPGGKWGKQTGSWPNEDLNFLPAYQAPLFIFLNIVSKWSLNKPKTGHSSCLICSYLTL